MRWGYPLAEIGNLLISVKKWNPRQSKTNELIKYIDIASVNRETKEVEGVVEFFAHEAPSRARQLVIDGDVLVSTVRPNLNAVAHLKKNFSGATASTGFTVLRSNSKKICDRYLYYWVRSPYFVQDMIRQSTGASYPAVSDSIVKAYNIPLPPLEEQRRIAKILDQADAIRRKRKEAIALTEELLRSTFLDMFGDPVANPKGWEVKPLDAILEVLHRYPTFYGCEYQKVGIPVLKIGSISPNGSIDSQVSSYDKVTKEFSDRFPKTVVKANDLVMAVRGDTTGKLGLVPSELSGANISPNLIRLSPNYNLCKPQYLFMVLHHGKRLIEKRINDTAKKSLTATTIKKVPIPVPSIAMQQRFEEAYKKITWAKNKTVSIEEESSKLFSSLLQKAFRGEL